MRVSVEADDGSARLAAGEAVPLPSVAIALRIGRRLRLHVRCEFPDDNGVCAEDRRGEYSAGTQGALMNDRETTIGTAPTRGADGRQESKRERLLCLMTAQKQI